MKNVFLIVAIIVTTSTYAFVFPNDRMAFRVAVIEERTGLPIEGVPVMGVFSDVPTTWGGSGAERTENLLTDKHGECRFTGSSNNGQACYVVKKHLDYYAAPLVRCLATHRSRHGLFWRCEPYDHVYTTVLQRVEHPIPLFLKRAKLFDRENGIGGFDGTNAVLKYDLMAGDWLPPHGKGIFADMKVSANFKTNETVIINCDVPVILYDFHVKIDFDGDGNGLYEKDFKGENLGIKFREAPESGYVHTKAVQFGLRKRQTTLVKWTTVEYYKESRDDRCYCFRIRSRFDEKGNLVEAYYGKIYGDFRFEGSDKLGGFMGAEFDYYLNPKSLDRNLEWDMKNNLDPESKKRRPWEPPFYRMEP